MSLSVRFPVNVRFFPSTLESIPLIVAVIITSSALGEVTVIELILFVGMFRPKLVRIAITPSQRGHEFDSCLCAATALATCDIALVTSVICALMSLVLTQIIGKHGINKIRKTETINRIFVMGGLPMIKRIRNAKGGLISIDKRNQVIPLLFMRFAYIATGIAKTIKTNKKEIPITIAVTRFLSLHGFNFFPFR